MNRINRRQALAGLGLGMLGAALPGARVWAAQEKWPGKPVNFIIPFPAGGPVDTSARFVAKPLGEMWGQAAVIDNKAGAGGIVAARLAARAAPDGYNFFFPAIHHAVHPSLRNDLGYDIQADFDPVGKVARFPIILCAHPSLGVKTVQDLVEKAKAKPGDITFSSSGTGGGTHLAGELFNSLAGVKLQHVPYRGSAPAMQDLVGGQVDLMFADAPSALPFIEGGRIIPLGVGNPEPSVLAPNVPPIAKAGVDGYEAYSWTALCAPKGTPKEIIAQLSGQLQSILKDPKIGPAMAAAGAEPMLGTPEDYAVFLDGEIKKWAKVIKEANIKIEG
ncbi:tripartite tricarboxylate transporter substrate binding protein [Pusillimonas sp. TS35]|uniref:Bug family tripartite tricarboxylate transporter substrate binding protein n=1 Tax=Paracandidimonas lactea TaxID=2895524 RepID=UPI00137049C9|nr:tripartite tricarboxylate transporter substrate binding protein [Paracandidimonas lactea]MYN13134.1 tripartite tricarboxylate transporter substrate binding protein [Pusillimonas sp. TS35]